MNLSAHLDLTATGRPLEGRLEFQGLQISVENAAGSVRKGYRPDGTMWKTKMEVPYGYIRMSKGVDGDHVDCFVGSNPNAANAYIIHIRKPPKFTRFDEDKVFLGFNSVADAKACFFKHYDDKRFFGSVDTIKMDDFKRKVLATKDDPKQLKAYSTGIGPSQQIHMDVTQTFHPPSLKNPDKVPADQPGEKNNRFGDVTRRHKRELERLRRDQTGHSSPLPSFPGALTTNVQSLQGGGPGSGCVGPNCGRPSVYHGTHSEFVKSILKKGLQPAKAMGRVAVFASEIKKEALGYAVSRTRDAIALAMRGRSEKDIREAVHKAEVALVVIGNPKVAGFTDSGNYQIQVSSKTVKPEHITRIEVYNLLAAEKSLSMKKEAQPLRVLKASEQQAKELYIAVVRKKHDH